MGKPSAVKNVGIMHAPARRRPYRLGLDLGTNSLGWFMVWLEREGKGWKPAGLAPGGVRVYPDGRDPKSGTSNAADRRDARGARRRRDRFLQRQQTLMAVLIRHGLMPADKAKRKTLEALDPYELRAKALDGPLPANHIGRALFHMNQRRGFQSNRKADKKGDEKGAIKQAAAHLSEMMDAADSSTLGNFLWNRHNRSEAATARTAQLQAELKRIGKDHLTGGARRREFAKLRKKLPDGSSLEQDKPEGVRARNTASGPKAAYDFYPTRQLFKNEFDAIWSAQKPHHSAMTDEARSAIWKAIFFQRDLREVPVGKCSLSPAKVPFDDDPEGYRVSWAHPLAQRFRILQEVRNLEIRETGKPARKLTKEQGDQIILGLSQNNKYSFDKMRTLLKLPEEARFNLEGEKRKELKGDATAERLSHKNLLNKVWRGYSPDRKIMIVERLMKEANEADLIEWLQSKCEINADKAEKIADAQLPDGHSRFGLRAIKMMLPHMEAGMPYHEAAKAAGLDHSKRPTGEILDALPYYGQWLEDAVVGTGDPKHANEQRFGKFPNPTVHIGLGQLRRLVNGLIEQYGAPEQIVIELARDLKISDDKKKEIEREQAKNQKKNEERKASLIGIVDNPSGADLLKMRLWEELGDVVKQCPFSGKPISLRQLMSHEVEVEHLIPYADSLDNKARNKTVCFKSANQLKGKMTPYEAFGHTAEWPDILSRANQLTPSKRWRFSSDARDRLNKDGRDFLDRQLMETSWLGKLAKQYLGAVCDPNAVWVVTGGHTALIRGKWGLNSLLPDHNFTDAKNRADHRHHAIDALVVAVTERSLLQRIAGAYEADRHKIEVPLPWETLRDDLQSALNKMTVSHKPDHGVEGKLHDETAYGFVKNPDQEEGDNLVYRKPLTSLTESEIDRIRDRRLREIVKSFVSDEKTTNGTALADALMKFNDHTHDPHIKHGLRRVRLLKSKKPEYLLQLREPDKNAPYKAYAADTNLFIEIFELPGGEWRGEAVTVHQANQERHVLRWSAQYPNAKFLMRVYKDDLLRIEHDGLSKVVRVVRLEPSASRIRLAAHNETGKLSERHDKADDSFRWIFGQYDRLKNWNAEAVRVDELGRVWRKHPPSPREPH